jgi:hypothetical protein
MSRAIPLLPLWALGVCYRANFFISTFNVLESKWDYVIVFEMIVEDSKVGCLL